MKQSITLLLLVLNLNVFSQTIHDITFNDLTSNKANFSGGDDELKKLFSLNLSYPMDNRYGTMVGIIVIDQEKNELKTLTVNSPGKNYEKEFKRVTQLTKNKWEKNDSVRFLYATLTLDFSFGEDEYLVDYSNQPKFIIGNIFLRNFSNKKLDSDEKLAQDLNEYYSQKNYKKILSTSKELITRNPFYPKIYIMRIKALNELGKDASVEQWMLTEFLYKKEYKKM